MMEQIEFSQLYTMDYTLGDLFAMRQSWKDGYTFRMLSPRPTCALVYLKSCDARYDFPEGGGFTAPVGSVICLPQGSRYSTTFWCGRKGAAEDLLLEFSIRGKAGEAISFGEKPFVLEEVAEVETVAWMEEIVKVFQAPVTVPGEIKGLVYRLLTRLGSVNRRREMAAREFRIILPGIDYMENDREQSLSIEEVAALCPVSPSCFRRLFHQYSGKSPRQYRLEAKISRAKELLRNGSVSVAEVAERLGYEEAYFCRIFKKVTGDTPGCYLRNGGRQRDEM